MTAVGFSQAASRKVYKKPQNGPPPDALSTSQITSDILNSSAESPMAPSPLVVKRENKKSISSKGLFSAMHNAKPEHVINFEENVKVRQFYCKDLQAQLQLSEFHRLILHCRSSQENRPALISCPVHHLGL